MSGGRPGTRSLRVPGFCGTAPLGPCRLPSGRKPSLRRTRFFMRRERRAPLVLAQDGPARSLALAVSPLSLDWSGEGGGLLPEGGVTELQPDLEFAVLLVSALCGIALSGWVLPLLGGFAAEYIGAEEEGAWERRRDGTVERPRAREVGTGTANSEARSAPALTSQPRRPRPRTRTSLPREWEARDTGVSGQGSSMRVSGGQGWQDAPEMEGAGRGGGGGGLPLMLVWRGKSRWTYGFDAGFGVEGGRTSEGSVGRGQAGGFSSGQDGLRAKHLSRQTLPELEMRAALAAEAAAAGVATPGVRLVPVGDSRGVAVWVGGTGSSYDDGCGEEAGEGQGVEAGGGWRQVVRNAARRCVLTHCLLEVAAVGPSVAACAQKMLASGTPDEWVQVSLACAGSASKVQEKWQ